MLMTKPWISDAKQRASEKYREMHRRLAEEVAADLKRTETRTGSKHRRHRLRSEYWREYAETLV